MISNEASARAFVASLGDDAAIARLERLAALLKEENLRQNLVSAASLNALWQRHFADSAQLLAHVPRETGVWLDLGTGAGFPGLVIAALRPHWAIRLVESRRRRVDWLRFCCLELGLPACEVLGNRLERVETFAAGVISARAFAPLPQLLDLSARFSTADTLWLLPKGRNARVELEALDPRRRKLFHVEQSRTDPEAGIIAGKLAQEGRRL